jgi:hypothetical protein
MILLTGFYNDASQERTGEFLECVWRNADNVYVEMIIVFLEDQLSSLDAQVRFPALAHPKVELIEYGRRLTYAQLFEYANHHLAGAGVIIANGDIFFDETLGLLETQSLTGKLFCLSRWDESPDGTSRHYDQPCSQDAWIFEPPLPRIDADFSLGSPGCDNRVAFEAERAGLAVSNPSRSVRARHLHHSGIHRYTQKDRIPGPIRLVPASFLEVPLERTKPPRPRPEDFQSHRGAKADHMADTRAREIEAVLKPYFGGVMPHTLRSELRHAVAARIDGPPPPRDVPLGSVAFREDMGYTIAQLELGVSTHNNDARPLVSVPPPLAGMWFTQVVANRASPVEIQFRTAGRVYVLAAPGWEGYAPAMAFLDDAGWREPVEGLQTRDGTVFQPWSLVGDAGERLVIPTQVMLAAAELIRLR